MDEYIERKAFKAEVRRLSTHYLNEWDTLGVLAAVDRIPAADVRPVRRGKWTLNKDGSGTCSECGRKQPGCWDLDNWDNFCHHGGADMREES